jgi:hypothetical protein
MAKKMVLAGAMLAIAVQQTTHAAGCSAIIKVMGLVGATLDRAVVATSPQPQQRRRLRALPNRAC